MSNFLWRYLAVAFIQSHLQCHSDTWRSPEGTQSVRGILLKDAYRLVATQRDWPSTFRLGVKRPNNETVLPQLIGLPLSETISILARSRLISVREDLPWLRVPSCLSIPRVKCNTSQGERRNVGREQRGRGCHFGFCLKTLPPFYTRPPSRPLWNCIYRRNKKKKVCPSNLFSEGPSQGSQISYIDCSS